ncbi:MAG TPA: TonB-dependent receptor [Fluviicola sp.]|nr:TonB-dependent receptor [Fluviicola sp.]
MLYSQQTFKGKVLNEENKPISNILITNEQSFERIPVQTSGSFEVTLTKNIPISISASGYETLYDTLRVGELEKSFILYFSQLELEEIQVKGIRADKNTPTTFSNLNKEDLRKNNFGQDLPYLLDGTLSTVVSSDAGAGVGYTNIRIRGVDPTRTNVTINGIPINDAESHGMYWVNMPDFASSTQNIQIQRGVGTSANGGAAFGASINVKSDNISRKAYAELDNSYGSFNTLKNTLKIGTGLINNRFAFDMRLSNIQSKGYMDRASSNLKSFYTSGAWLGKKSVIKFNIFGGREITYQAWNGVPESRLKNDQQGMLDYINRNWLSPTDAENLLNSGRTYNPFTYNNQVDHYTQTHYQLHFNHQFNEAWKLNVSAHYTRGKGYYEEYKTDQDLEKYGLAPVVVDSLTTITNSDIIRRKWLDNHFYGMVYSVYYSKKNVDLTIGGGINQYLGKHYGTVIWARYASNSEINHTYYTDDAMKVDFNTFVKFNYHFKHSLIFSDVQLRTINYTYEGISDLSNTAVNTTQHANYVFLNPKLGWMYQWKNNDLYASIAVANREPIRKDFTENVSGNRPKPETLYDLEIGNRFHKNKWSFNVNYFMMYYQNQLILTGKINDVGDYTRTNAKESYRTGLEAEATFKATKWLTAFAGATYSLNKIIRFTEYVDDYDNGGQVAIEHKNSDLAFSPNVIAQAGLNFEPVSRFNIRISGKYVGRQFMDNSSVKSRSIDGYYLMNFNMSYLLKVPKIDGIEFGIQVNNLLNTKYANNGYTYGYMYNQERVVENFYFPQAGINVMGRVVIRI